MEGEQVRKYNPRGISKHNVVVTYPAFWSPRPARTSRHESGSLPASYGKMTMAWSSYISLKGRPKPDKEVCTQSTAIFSHECLPLVDKDAQWLFLSSL